MLSLCIGLLHTMLLCGVGWALRRQYQEQIRFSYSSTLSQEPAHGQPRNRHLVQQLPNEGDVQQLKQGGANNLPTFSSPAAAVVSTTTTTATKVTSWAQEWLDHRLEGEPARILLVHVGKTGGTSLIKGIPLPVHQKRDRLLCVHEVYRSRMLRAPHQDRSLESIWDQCYHPRPPRPHQEETAAAATSPPSPPLLAQHVWAHKHLSSMLYPRRELEWILFKVNTFLVTTRNPVARIVSTFNYHLHGSASTIQAIQKKMKRSDSSKETTRTRTTKVDDRAHETDNDEESRREDEHDGGSADDEEANENDDDLYVGVNVPFFTCFENIDALAQHLIRARQNNNNNQTNNQTNNSKNNVGLSTDDDKKQGIGTSFNECLHLAQTILQGTGPKNDDLHHFYHNYQYYKEVTMERRPEVPVLVVRTEHLWEDAQSINAALSGSDQQKNNDDKGRDSPNGDDRSSHLLLQDPNRGHESHGSETYKVTSGLSSVQGRQAICCAIVSDLIAYQSIILQALNLNVNEKRDTLQAALDECGISSDQENDLVQHPFSWIHWYNETCRSHGN